MSPMALVKSNSPDYHSSETTSFLRGLAALGKSTSSERNGAGATKTRARVSERNARRTGERASGDRSPRQYVVLLSWPKRKIDARRPVENQSRRVADAETMRAQAPQHVSDGTAVVCSPPTPLPPPPRQGRAFSLSFPLLCPVLPLSVLSSFSLHESLRQLACAARREAGLRGDFRSGESVDVEFSGK